MKYTTVTAILKSRRTCGARSIGLPTHRPLTFSCRELVMDTIRIHSQGFLPVEDFVMMLHKCSWSIGISKKMIVLDRRTMSQLLAILRVKIPYWYIYLLAGEGQWPSRG